MITFDDFVPGNSFGSAAVHLDEALFARWLALFPADAERRPNMPEGMTAVLVMNAYMELIAPRPPGNVHASQNFRLTRLPRIGDVVRTEVTCDFKEERKGRRWIGLETMSRDETGDTLFTGQMRMIWAA